MEYVWIVGEAAADSIVDRSYTDVWVRSGESIGSPYCVAASESRAKELVKSFWTEDDYNFLREDDFNNGHVVYIRHKEKHFVRAIWYIKARVEY